MGNDKSKKIIGTGIVAAGITAVGAVSHAITKNLVNIAVDREMPHKELAEGNSNSLPYKAATQAVAKFKGSEDDADFREAVAEAAQNLKNREHTLVEITAQDGEKLVGHWFPCNNAKRIVVAMHGWRSSWCNDFGMISEFLHTNGCSVLYAEQRGQGSSGGDYMGLGVLERFDCKDWADWIVNTQSNKLPIFLSGVSMGATTVLMATGLPLHENVHGVIADCGFTSPHEISKHVVENNLHMSYGIRGEIADALCKKKIQLGTKAYSAIDAMKENRIPVLFIHGADDTFVPVTMTYDNYKACIAPKELLIVPGADHAMSYYVDREKYEEAVKAFWLKNE